MWAVHQAWYLPPIFGNNTALTIPYFKDIIEDKDGNLWILGYKSTFLSEITVSANAVQPSASALDFGLGGNFIVKFSKSGQYLYSSYVFPVYGLFPAVTYMNGLATDAQGNLYLSGGFVGATEKVSNITNFYNLAGWVPGRSGSFVARIPYNLSPQYDFVSVFTDNYATQGARGERPNIALDKKGNIHLAAFGNQATPISLSPLTAGNLNINSGTYYFVLSPSGGSMLYGTGVSSSGSGLLSVNDK